MATLGGSGAISGEDTALLMGEVFLSCLVLVLLLLSDPIMSDSSSL